MLYKWNWHCGTWVVADVSRPSHRLMNWAFIMAVASWSRLERFLRKDSKTPNTGIRRQQNTTAQQSVSNRWESLRKIEWGWNKIRGICSFATEWISANGVDLHRRRLTLKGNVSRCSCDCPKQATPPPHILLVGFSNLKNIFLTKPLWGFVIWTVKRVKYDF